MNKEWDLSPLYAGIDSAKYQEDLKTLTQAVADYNAFAAAMPEDRGAAIHRALELQERLTELVRPMFEYASLRSSVNTSDSEALDTLSCLQKLMSEVSAADAAVHAYVGKTAELESLIAADPFLGDYAYLLRTMQDDAKYVLDEKVEEALAKMNLSGGSAWENLQSYLSSSVEAEYRGQKLPLSAVRNLAYDPDPAVRKDAYDAEIACYDKIKDGVCFSLNSLKQQVTTECEMRQGGSPLEMTLRASRMQKRTLD
ncbi:MAG: peptidase M3, partial [Oscillospiraceae bacterium]|nr:peptidase M3 [Oscillospiraceae bacterium]